MWRHWKNNLKSKHFNVDLFAEKMKVAVLECCDENQWRRRIDMWLTEKSMHLSETNKKNRAKYDDPHCTGSKSFARVIDEKTKANNGVRPSHAKLYIETRTKKDGSYVNDKMAEIYELMKEGMQEVSGSESTEGQRYWNNDVYSHVKGPKKRGRIHCVEKVSSCSKATSSTSVEQERESTHLRNIVQHLGSEVD
ncbi:uncharacterized protein [Elaeis guineensis]